MRGKMNRLGNNILAWLALTVVFAIMGSGAALGLLSYGNVTAQELSASAADKKLSCWLVCPMVRSCTGRWKSTSVIGTGRGSRGFRMDS